MPPVCRGYVQNTAEEAAQKAMLLSGPPNRLDSGSQERTNRQYFDLTSQRYYNFVVTCYIF